MKKLSMALAIGALVLSVAGASFAADLEVNIYGASAQGDFWGALAPVYLNAAGGANCTGGAAVCATFTPTDNAPAGVYYHGAKYIACEAQGPCTVGPVAAADKFRIRVTAYDSDDGVLSVLGHANPSAVDVMQCPTAVGLNYRTMLKDVSAAACGNLACYPVTLGASDVNGSTIIQSTEGQLDGPAGPASVTQGKALVNPGCTAGAVIPIDLGDFSATPPTVKTCGTGILVDHHPFIVPFAFFANKQAFVGDVGNLLQANLTNITKTMVQEIFSGAVTDWHTYFPAIPAGSTITTCMRVAGSGTMATFQAAVMDSNKTGPALPNLDNSILGNNAWFNNTSGDMVNCIATVPGSIGFVDPDKALAGNEYGPITYNGVAATAANIKNGTYDSFWTLEHLFEPVAKYVGYPPAAVITSLTGYCDNNIPPAKAATWTLSNGMTFHKTGDFVTPPQLGAYVEGTCYE